MNSPQKTSSSGFTLIEIIIVAALIAVLASVALPLADLSVKRSKEIELRRALRIIRESIDDYRLFVAENKIKLDRDRYNYPESLEELVTGVEYRDKKNNSKIRKFLRAVPIDPMTQSYDWGLRSYQDKRDSSNWGGENVYDVYTKSEAKALDNSYYKEW